MINLIIGKKVEYRDLVQYLRPITEWQTLGSYLNLPVEEIQIIYASHKNDVEECQHELYRRYLRMGDRSWRTVLAAVRKCGYPNLAKDIIEKLGLAMT